MLPDARLLRHIRTHSDQQRYLRKPAMSIIPFDDRDGTIWFDGKLVPWRDAKIHVLTHALHYASCVFEGERVYGGKVFHLDEHSERLINSAKLLGFEIPIDRKAINDATNAVV